MTDFLSVYQRLIQAQPTITGLWLLHGDEPLLAHLLLEVLRPLFKRDNQHIKRLELLSANSWYEVVSALDNISLFGEANALIVSGKYQPNKTALDALTEFAQSDSPDCLIYELPKQDKKAQGSALFRLFANFGTVVDCNIPNEPTRHAILQQQAKTFGIQLSDDGWQLLMHATENNLLSAYQHLWQLSHLFPNGVVSTSDIQSVLMPEQHYTVFHLSDSLLLGDAEKSLQILTALRHSNTAPSLILWTISKDIRTLLALKHQSAQTLGIWSSKLNLYTEAYQRGTINENMLRQVFYIDCLIKGVEKGDVWQAFTELCLQACGILPAHAT